jgi:hypothetical protein
MPRTTGVSGLKALALSLLLTITAGMSCQAAKAADCASPPCSSYVPAVDVPGWVHDTTFQGRGTQIFAPPGAPFYQSSRWIGTYVLVKPDNQTVADHLASGERSGPQLFPGIRYFYLPDVPRGDGQEPFHIRLSEKSNDPKFELSALTINTDRAGHSYFVTIALAANDLGDLNATVPLFQAALRSLDKAN